jgi:polyisoprenyl-phosphate glycosyltransferase
VMGDRVSNFSVIIPVYNSAACLPELAERLAAVLSAMEGRHEVIFVDDASPDECWPIIRDLARRYPNFKGLQLMKNLGQHQATIIGMRHATGDIVITMDDDLQHDPAHIPRLVSTLDEGASSDAVFAYFPEKKHAGYRNWGSKCIGWINARAIGVKATIKTSSFRALRRHTARAIAASETANPAISGLILGVTSRVRSIPIPHHDRYAGRSNYTLAKQLRLALDNICNVSMLPLRVIAALGFAAAFFSGVLTIYFLYRYLAGLTAVAGWTTLVILISFFSGVILLALGVVGEYMVRVLRELTKVTAQPLREQVGFDAVAQPGEVR